MILTEALAVRCQRADRQAADRGMSQGGGGIAGWGEAPSHQCHQPAQIVTSP